MGEDGGVADGWQGARVHIGALAVSPRTNMQSRLNKAPPHGWAHAPALLLPMTMRPRRSRMSAMSVVSASTAMISLATAMSKPGWWVVSETR